MIKKGITPNTLYIEWFWYLTLAVINSGREGGTNRDGTVNIQDVIVLINFTLGN